MENTWSCYVAQVRDLVPESQAYMDLLSFERKLDSTITRKRLDIQEALKRPMKAFHGLFVLSYFIIVLTIIIYNGKYVTV